MKKSMLVLVLIVFTTLFSQTGVPPANGNGTEENPYEIVSLGNLLWISQNSDEWDKHYRQMNNIDASDTENWYAGAGWIPIGNETIKFSGFYDGDNHVIDGLNINRIAESDIGFFGNIYGCTISNLGLTNVHVSGNSNVGSIAGIIHASNVTKCYSSGNITGNGENIGGIVGNNYWSSFIILCFSDAIVTGFENTGGLVGINEQDAVVSNSNFIGKVVRISGTHTSFGAFCGTNFNGEIEDSYTIGSVFNSDGSTAFSSDKGFVGNDVSGQYTSNFFDSEKSNQSTATGATAKTTTQMKTQSTFTGWDFINESINGNDDIWTMSSDVTFGGYPTLEWTNGYSLEPNQTGGIYQIETLTNLVWITENPNRWSYDFEQTATLNLAISCTWNEQKGFTPIGNATNRFSGTYNGNDHLIENLYIKSSTTSQSGDNQGVFGYCEGSSVILQNIGIINSNITGSDRIGALAGNIDNGKVLNCYSSGSVSGNSFVGGLVGYIYYSNSLIRDSYSYCNVNGTQSYHGGLVGKAYLSEIYNCYSAGNVNGDWAVGGFVGDNSLSIINRCYSTGNVSGRDKVAGLAGWSGYGSAIINSYSVGDVTRKSAQYVCLAAFCGTTDDLSSITNSYSLGSVYETDGISPFATNLGFVYEHWNSSFSNNFFDSESSNQITAMGATAKTTTEMQLQSTFTDSGWDFSEVWAIDAEVNYGYPYLQWQFSAPVPPDSPENAQISINEGIVTITWNEVPDATSYKIFSSDTPNGEFTEETDGAFDGFSWSKVVSNSKKFYHVKAVN